jgi:membrane-associated phospholipid phosphatase
LRVAFALVAFSLQSLALAATSSAQSHPDVIGVAVTEAEPSNASKIDLEVASDPFSPVVQEPQGRGGAMAELVKPIPRDFVRLFTWTNGIITAAGGASALIVSRIDQDVANSDWGNVPHPTFRPGQYTGNAVINIASGLALYTVGRTTENRTLRAVGSGIFRAQLVSQGITQIIKPVVHRERPDGSNYRSFPSGHSATSFATATVLQEELGWKAGLPAYAIAVWTGASRIYHHKHYVSDVVFGATIGIVSARAVTVGRNELRFALSASALPRGWQVTLTKVD